VFFLLGRSPQRGWFGVTPASTVARPQLREITPDGQLRLHFHRGQLRVWDSTARFPFMFAGSQGGKTSFGPHWLHREMTVARDRLNAGERLGDFLAATSTFDMFKLKMLPEMREVFENILNIGRYWAGEKVLELSDNLEPGGKFWAQRQDDKMYGRIILRSAEAPSGLEASTAKAAWCDEIGQPEFTLSTFEAIVRRLATDEGRLLGTSTLYSYGWLKTEVFDKWFAGDTDYDVINFDSTENPAFPQKEFDRAYSNMPLWKFNMFYRGIFTKPAGMVYDCFDDKNCVIDRFPIPDNWLWYVGHDFGGANPAALLYAQDPKTGLFYLVHEYLPGAKAVPDQVEELKALLKGRVVIRRTGGSRAEQDSRQNYTAHGWPIAEPAVWDVAVRISRVYAFHKRNGIMVFKDCKRYLDEKLRYSYKLGQGYEVMDDIEGRSRFHLMSAEEYIMCGFYADGVVGQGPTQTHVGEF